MPSATCADLSVFGVVLAEGRWLSSSLVDRASSAERDYRHAGVRKHEGPHRRKGLHRAGPIPPRGPRTAQRFRPRGRAPPDDKPIPATSASEERQHSGTANRNSEIVAPVHRKRPLRPCTRRRVGPRPSTRNLPRRRMAGGRARAKPTRQTKSRLVQRTTRVGRRIDGGSRARARALAADAVVKGPWMIVSVTLQVPLRGVGAGPTSNKAPTDKTPVSEDGTKLSRPLTPSSIWM